MKSIEISHKTVEEAIDQGLQDLELSIQDVEVEVLDEGSRGFFGIIGAKQARVRLTLRQESEATEEKESAHMPKIVPVVPPSTTPAPVQGRLPDDGPAIQEAKAFLASVALHMGLDVSISCYKNQEDNSYYFEILGDEKGILIGHRGETLDALQYLSSLVLNKGKDTYCRLQLDSQNYRQKREETLMRLAQRLAEKAIKTRKRVALEPMNPYERRILHATLQDNPAVLTRSEGEEPNRRVVILPK